MYPDHAPAIPGSGSEAVEAGAVPAGSALEVGDAAFTSGAPLDQGAEGSSVLGYAAGRSGLSLRRDGDGAHAEVVQVGLDAGLAVAAAGGHRAGWPAGPAGEAMTMGDRVCVLLDGVLQQVDSPRTLYDEPTTVFVAGFIGSPAMNIKTVPVTDKGARFVDMLLPLTRQQIAAARTDGGRQHEHRRVPTRAPRPDRRGRRRDADHRRPRRGPRLRRVRLRPRDPGRQQRTIRRSHQRPRHPRTRRDVNVKPHPGRHHALQNITGKRI